MVTGNPDLDEAAAESGAMGFVVKPPGEEIASVVATARERFGCFLKIREQAADIEEALKTWGLAWSAVKALVREQGVSEADACRELKRRARGQGASMRVAAEQVLARLPGGDARG
jgi:AmiR/NasT family two-component response regulator